MSGAGAPSAARRSWGWHALRPQWAERIVAEAGIRPGDHVVDLGAGTGALTGPLVRSGARVTAVELHPGRVRALRTRFGTDEVRVIPVDLAGFRPPEHPFRVVANPPFAGINATVRRLVAPGSAFQGGHLVVPRGYAIGLIRSAPPKRFCFSIGRRVPASAFRPSPSIETCVLVITRR